MEEKENQNRRKNMWGRNIRERDDAREKKNLLVKKLRNRRKEQRRKNIFGGRNERERDDTREKKACWGINTKKEPKIGKNLLGRESRKKNRRKSVWEKKYKGKK